MLSSASARAYERERGRTKLTRNELVLQCCSIGQLNLASFVGDNNDGTTKSNVTSESDISDDLCVRFAQWVSLREMGGREREKRTNGQVIQFEDIGRLRESLEERSYLLEVISELFDRHPSSAFRSWLARSTESKGTEQRTLMTGVVENIRLGLRVKQPCSRSYKSDLINNKSLHDLTGRKRERCGGEREWAQDWDREGT